MENTITTINAQGQKKVEQYFKAVDGAKKSAWKVAEVVSKTVNDEKFETMFGSLSVYADAIKMSKGSISMMARAYRVYNDNECLNGFTYTAVSAMLALPDNMDVEQFVATYEITKDTPVSEIKAHVKALKALTTETEETEGTEETPESANGASETETADDSTESDTEIIDTISVPANEDLLIINGKVFNLSKEDVDNIKEVLGL